MCKNKNKIKKLFRWFFTWLLFSFASTQNFPSHQNDSRQENINFISVKMFRSFGSFGDGLRVTTTFSRLALII